MTITFGGGLFIWLVRQYWAPSGTSTLVQHCINIIQMFCICWVFSLPVTIRVSVPGGRGPRVVVSTAAFHAEFVVRFPVSAVWKKQKMFLPHPRVKVSIVGSLHDREVACSASDRQGSNFESCVRKTVSSQSSHHPQEVLLAQFSLNVHKGGLRPESFHFISVPGLWAFMWFLEACSGRWRRIYTRNTVGSQRKGLISPRSRDHRTQHTRRILNKYVINAYFNPFTHHDALKHHFTSLKTDLVSLQLGVLELKFPWNWFTNTW